MRILLAKDAGYCFGVRDAVNMAYDTAKEYDEVFMLGDIVHNETVVRNLARSGTKVVADLKDVPKGKPVLFRAHGTVPELWEKAREGRRTIIIGDHGHDEVVAIAAQVSEPIIIANPEEAHTLRKMKKAGVVSQSTQMIENVQGIINILIRKVFDLRFINTICFPTRRNHEQIKELAVRSDTMIVIGSFTSANSKRLTQLALERNPRSYQVTSVEDLDPDWFKDSEIIGISAGASTPDNIISEIVEKIKIIGQITEKEEVYE